MPLLFPDDRLAVDIRTGRTSKAKSAQLFLDEALTVPAAIYAGASGAPDGTFPTTGYRFLVRLKGASWRRRNT